MVVYLVRHTQPIVGPETCYGRLDVALAPTWREDVDECLKSIAPVSRIYSSAAIRCRALAEALGDRELTGIQIDARLAELDFADWEGRRWDAIPRSCIDAWAADLIHYAPGNGESLAALWARVDAFRNEVIYGDADLVVVSHHGPLRALAAQLGGEAPDRMFTRQWPWGSVHRIELSGPQGTGECP